MVLNKVSKGICEFKRIKQVIDQVHEKKIEEFWSDHSTNSGYKKVA